MSLILDALKKSEAERRLGQAPGLSSAFLHAPRRDRGPLLWSLLLLVVVSVAAFWHNRELFGFAAEAGDEPADRVAGDAVGDQERRDDPATASAVSGGTGRSTDRSTERSTDQSTDQSTDRPGGAARGSTVGPGVASLPMPKPRPLAAPADEDDPLAGVSAQHRELIEQGKLVVPNPQILAQRGATRDPQIVTAEAALPPTIEAPAAVETEDGRLVYPTEAPATPASLPPVREQSPIAGTPTGAGTAAASSDPPPGLPPDPGSPPAPPPVSAPAVAPSTPGVPLIYDLSLSQRQGLPELKMSMHVYHRDVARRFVIIDGRRLNEGDPIGQLLWAREIVPEGVIIEYRDVRFLLPRPGG